MASYEISVFITKEVYDHGDQAYGEPYRARDIAALYLEEGIERHSSHTVDIIYGDETPDPPQENIAPGDDDSFGGPCICQPFNRCTWSDIYDWWVEWFNSGCKDPHKEAQDTNLLITKGGAQGLGGGQFAVAGGGGDITALPSFYEDHGFQDRHHHMWVILHEVGHSLIPSPQDCDVDGVGHDTGAVFSFADGYAKSPMGVSHGINDCCKTYDTSKVDSGRALYYSNCSEDNFK